MGIPYGDTRKSAVKKEKKELPRIGSLVVIQDDETPVWVNTDHADFHCVTTVSKGDHVMIVGYRDVNNKKITTTYVHVLSGDGPGWVFLEDLL